MDADARKLTGNLNFLFKCEGNPRGLFPVTECRIKNGHVVLRTAIGEEDDPPQNPCEPYLVIAPGLFKETLHQPGFCHFHPLKNR
jgi:hypothetical protein